MGRGLKSVSLWVCIMIGLFLCPVDNEYARFVWD